MTDGCAALQALETAHHGERAGVPALGLAQLAADHAGPGAGRLGRLAGGAGRAAGALQ